MLPEAPASRPYTLNNILIAAGASAIYLLVSWRLIGFTGDQVVLCLLFSSFYLATFATRKFILAFSIFIVYWIIFDYMKAFPNYLFNDVHIKDLYDTEKSLFGFSHNNIIVTPYEYFAENHWTFADFMSGMFYICWIPVPLGFGIFLYFKNRQQFLYFALTFITTNLFGWTIYYSFPAAPPWYVMKHGFEFYAHTPADIGGLIRFDELFGVRVFQSIYEKSSNVFAAMPSLHSAYPMVVLYYGLKNRIGWMNVVFATVVVGIWCTAVYTGHHYVLDILVGICCAIAGIVSFNLLLKINRFKRLLETYQKAIS